MSNRAISTRLLALGVVGAGVLMGAAFGPSATPAEGDVTPADGGEATPARADGSLILLLADEPLASEPAPSKPPLDLAGDEILLNAAIVPEVTIQAGLYMRRVYADSVDGRSFSVVEWPADVALKRHWHPVTERLWMIEGSIASPADGEVGPGTFWEAPAQVAMGPFTSTGSLFALLGEGPFETHYLHAGEPAPRAGTTSSVDPDTLPWRSFADVTGSELEGRMKQLSPRTETDRAVYLVRLDGSAAPASARQYSVFGANLEGYVLAGTLRLTDPYHGIHLLAPGFYFRIPAGFPSSLSAAPE